MDMQKIGIREFRAELAGYVATAAPVAITRHGETVGYFIPTRRTVAGDAEIEALKAAANLLDKLLAEKGVSEDALLEDYKATRKRGVGRRA